MAKGWFHNSNCFLARYPVDPARREEFLSALNDMFAFAEPWYEEHAHFAFHGWARDPNTWVVIAAWKSEEILERLRKEPEFQKHSVRMLECCTGPMVIEQFSGMKVDRSVFDLYPAGKSEVHLPTQSLGVEFV